nr:immunoglobulin light chain junction region [Macaca mulatta]
CQHHSNGPQLTF